MRDTKLYYLQSRYYDPAIGRFINADTFASTDADGFLGYNMFAYCENNPFNNDDPTGLASSSTADVNHNGIPDYLEERWIEQTNRYKAQMSRTACRNVTNEINTALEKATNKGRATGLLHPITKWPEFYSLVNHKKPWDIKREAPWEKTIGTVYPGSDQAIVIYEEHYYTPEILGNYTYGALGKAYGFTLETLFVGSYYAAKMPKPGTSEYDNEMRDWLFIANGYYSGH